MKLTADMSIRFSASVMLALCACTFAQAKKLEVTVENISGFPLTQATVELPADSVLGRLGSPYCYVTDRKGKELTSQITYDGKLIFQTDLSAGGSARFTVRPSAKPHSYPSRVGGRVYPERADDLAWENEVNGYRAYGPATQRKGERGFGYDLFFKHATPELILDRLYAPETDPASWQKADSLRKIDPKLADDFIKTISYHVDNGLGMDCYAVGPTLGAGVAAIMAGDTIFYPWCCDRVEVLDNGPLRFTARMDFAPVAVAGEEGVTEHRLVSLDAGSYLNRTKVWYDGLTHPVEVVVGFPLRDDFTPFIDEYTIAYSDPTQGPDNGRAQLGIVSERKFSRRSDLDSHILGTVTLAPADTLSYSWGFAWDREAIRDIEAWKTYLGRYRATEVILSE